MKPFFITLLGILSFGITAVPAAEQETAQTAGDETAASSKSGYAKVSDNDKQIDRAVENRSERSAFTSRRRAEKNGKTVSKPKKDLSTPTESNISRSSGSPTW